MLYATSLAVCWSLIFTSQTLKVVLILQSNSWQESGYLYFPKMSSCSFYAICIHTDCIVDGVFFFVFFFFLFLQLVTNWLVKKTVGILGCNWSPSQLPTKLQTRVKYFNFLCYANTITTWIHTSGSQSVILCIKSLQYSCTDSSRLK